MGVNGQLYASGPYIPEETAPVIQSHTVWSGKQQKPLSMLESKSIHSVH
jgi:hypothetical protein